MSAVDPPANGNVLKWRVENIEQRLVGHEAAVREVDRRLDEKDTRDALADQKMDQVIEGQKSVTNWLKVTAGSFLVAAFAAVLALIPGGPL